MIDLHPIASRCNNYIWALVNTATKQALVVDPGEAQPVIDWLTQNNYQLEDIFITHHHHDHVDGLPALIDYFHPNIYAAKADHITGTTHPLLGEEQLCIPYLDATFSVINIPGHTAHHVAFYSAPYLFCGDTLFSAGCGRVLQGTIEDLYHSLQLLKTLPDDTLVCCAHEYTLNNIHFAKLYDPDNAALLAYEAKIQTARNNNQPSLPSTIGIEKAVNPFLRTASLNLEAPSKTSFQIFKALRQHKDHF